MVDFHTHILPGIDDGSRSVEESGIMLKLLREQGVDLAVATPHFNANRTTPEEFLRRREAAKERLARETGESPRLLMGAEVAYFDGISRCDIVEELCIEGTRTLLLEMPLIQWTSRVLAEAESLQYQRNINVVLAHIERYLPLQSRDICERLFSDGLALQMNVDTLLSFRTRRLGIRLLKNGQIRALGSDCHGAQHRPPRMKEAALLIGKRLGDETVACLDRSSRELLRSAAEGRMA